MRNRRVLLALFVLVFLFCFPACDPDDDDDNDTATDDDAGDDDDDDDVTDDDDTADDDITDDDTADDDTADDDTVVEWEITDGVAHRGDLSIETVDGGMPGEGGVSVAVLPNNEIAVAAVRSRFLYLFRENGDADGELLAPFVRDPQMAVDAAGALHIVYLDTWYKRIMYLTDASGQWVTTAIVLVDLVDPPAFALDAQGKAHIAYALDGEVRYVTNAAGSWQVETAGTNGAGAPSLAVDANGAAHIAYLPAYNKLEYLTNASGQWQRQTVHAIMGDYQYFSSLSIAVAGDDTPHIAYAIILSYSHASDVTMMYASREGDHWTKKILPKPTPFIPGNFTADVRDVALRIDAQNQAHIALAIDNAYFTALVSLTNVTGVWLRDIMRIDICDAFGHVGLALDGSGGEHIAALHKSSGQLLLYDKPLDEWEETILDIGTRCGIGATIAVGATGTHFAYADWQTEDVRYARKDNDGWLRETVGEQGIWGFQQIRHGNAVTLDAAGEPHIAYAYFDDDDNRWIRYAVRDDGWSSQIMTSTGGGWLEHVAIVVNEAGYAHIVYDGFQANYATNESGSWQAEQIISRPTWEGGGQVLALALDADGTPHAIFDAGRIGFYGLLYATGTFGDWTIEEIPDSSLYKWGEGDIAIDANGAAHVVYCGNWDSEISRAIYLTNAAGFWTMETIDEQPLVSYLDQPLIGSCAIALDDQGRALVVYGVDAGYRATTGKVKYATKFSGEWRSVYVDRADGVGEYLDIALADDDTVHLAYFGVNAAWHGWFPKDYTE